MSVVKLREGLYEVRWREEGRQKTKRIHGGYDLARKVLRKKLSTRDENRHLDVKKEINWPIVWEPGENVWLFCL